MMAPRVRAYLRVSSDGQTVENQRADIEDYARARRYEIAHVYEETGSASKARPVFNQMRTDARRGRFDILVVWALDRFGRSLAGNVSAVTELDEVGVSVASVREEWLEVRGPVRPLLIAILSWVAEQERAHLIARTNAGIARARAQGVRFGRPVRDVDVALVLERRASGDTVGRISRSLKVSKSTIVRALRKAKAS